METIEKDIWIANVCVGDVNDCDKWKGSTRVEDPLVWVLSTYYLYYVY